MARSQLLKDLISGESDLENILMRLKVILTAFKNDPILNWINGELSGYDPSSDLPVYRIQRGNIMGTYFVNGVMQHTNQLVPLNHTEVIKEFIPDLEKVNVVDGISTIQNYTKKNQNNAQYAKLIPSSFCHIISNDQIQVQSMRAVVPHNSLETLVSTVKTKLIDIILELETKYDKLDELDIQSQLIADRSKMGQVVVNIEKIIYEGSISIGDSNKLNDSTIGHGR